MPALIRRVTTRSRVAWYLVERRHPRAHVFGVLLLEASIAASYALDNARTERVRRLSPPNHWAPMKGAQAAVSAAGSSSSQPRRDR